MRCSMFVKDLIGLKQLLSVFKLLNENLMKLKLFLCRLGHLEFDLLVIELLEL